MLSFLGRGTLGKEKAPQGRHPCEGYNKPLVRLTHLSAFYITFIYFATATDRKMVLSREGGAQASAR